MGVWGWSGRNVREEVDSGDRLSVEGLVRILLQHPKNASAPLSPPAEEQTHPLNQDRPLQTDTSKQSLALRVRKDGSGVDEGRVDRSSNSDRSCSSRQLSSNRHVPTLGKRLDRVLRVEHHDELQRASASSEREGAGGPRTSLKSAPICSPNPTPPVAMQEGALQVPSGKRAMTIPLPALPDQTNPALSTVKMAKLRALVSSGGGGRGTGRTLWRGRGPPWGWR